jgi:DNA-binding HxlR family transcriptional regulator
MIVHVPYKAFNNQNCSIAASSAIFGERWSLLVMREILLGRRHFQEIKRNTGVASNILTDRLQTLVEHGLLTRKTRITETGAESTVYAPTRKGVDVQPIILAIMQWGDKYEAPHGAPRLVMHSACGQEANPTMVCAHCGERILPSDTYTLPGPGADERQIAAGRLPAEREAA